MEEKKHIDRLFQEKLKDFEVFPDTKVWKNIENELLKKKKRRILPLWLRYGSAAAILLFLMSTGIWFFEYPDYQESIVPNTNTFTIDTLETQSITTKEKQSKQEVQKNLEKMNNPTIVKERIPTNSSTVFVKGSTIQKAAEVKLRSQQKEKLGTIKETIATNTQVAQQATRINENMVVDKAIINDENKESVASNTLINTNKESNIPLSKKDLMETVEENKVDEEVKLIQKKWSVGSTVAPIYFNTLSKGSPIDANLANNRMSSEASISYGVKVNYKINDRLSFQSGINAVDLAYETADVITSISSNSSFTNGTNIATNVSGFNIVAFSSNNIAVENTELLAPQRGFFNLKGNLNQTLSYIEIPMEASYNLVQKKLGVNVVGGLSTFILYDNNVSLLNENGSTFLGEANNINDLNFSGNLGLDFDYNINKKLFINISPMFKYQFNTFSKNAGGFQPYYLGVYTGLNFRF